MWLVVVGLVFLVNETFLELVCIEFYALCPQLFFDLLEAGHFRLEDLLLADGSCLLAAKSKLAIG